MFESIALPSSVLESLGRLAWAAMNLEDWANAVCEKALGENDSRIPIGPHIDSAVAELESWEQNEDLAAATKWLVEAKARMIQRNEILHAVPTRTVHSPASGRPSKPGLVYSHKRPKVGARQDPTYTAMNSWALDPIANSIEETLAGYSDAYSAISAARAQNQHRNKS